MAAVLVIAVKTAREILSMYVRGLAKGARHAAQAGVGGRLAEILFFGGVPSCPGCYQ